MKNCNILSACELNELLEIIHSLVFIEDNDQFRGVAHSLRELIEGDYIFFGFPKPSSNKTWTVGDLNINYPQEWIDLCLTNWQINPVDPIVLAARKECTPQHWGDIHRRFPSRNSFLELASDFEIKEGWVCFTKGGMGGGLPWTMITVGGKFKNNKNNKKREKYIFEKLSPYLHIALSSLRVKNEAKKLQGLLTTREREVLKWLSQGKTSWEMSIILNVAEATINFHVKNINAKLNTVSRSHAVAVATCNSLVNV